MDPIIAALSLIIRTHLHQIFVKKQKISLMTHCFQSQTIFQVASDPCKIGVSGKPDDTPGIIYSWWTIRLRVLHLIRKWQ